MEKYLKIILIFLISGMAIEVLRNQITIFYILLGGAIILIFYDAKQKRKERRSK